MIDPICLPAHLIQPWQALHQTGTVPTNNLSRHQQRRKHLLPVFFAHLRRGIGRNESPGFKPITAFRAGPKIDDQVFTYEFRPIRSNQCLTTFDTCRRHGDPPLLLVLCSKEFLAIVASPARRSALIQIKNEPPWRHSPHCTAIMRKLRSREILPGLRPPESRYRCVGNSLQDSLRPCRLRGPSRSWNGRLQH